MTGSPSLYRFGAATVAVAFDAAPTREWLDEAVSPWFVPDCPAAAPVSYRVELVRAGDPRRALGVDRPPADHRACFALDSRALVFPAWPSDDSVVLEDARWESWLEIGASRTRVVARPDALAPRISLLRVVREAATIRRTGDPTALALHAAAFSVAGRTVLVLGPKASGKTTLLLHVLATGEARLVANDRVCVDWNGAAGPPRAVGVPTFVRVRPPTLEMFPELARGLPADLRPVVHSFRELAALPPGRAGALPPRAPDGHLVMTPAQLCRQVGAQPDRGGPLAAFLLLEHAPVATAADWRLEPLGKDAARDALLANRYGLATRSESATVFAERLGAEPPSEALESELARCVAEQVPVLRCRVGFAHRSEPGRAAALLRALPV